MISISPSGWSFLRACDLECLAVSVGPQLCRRSPVLSYSLVR